LAIENDASADSLFDLYEDEISRLPNLGSGQTITPPNSFKWRNWRLADQVRKAVRMPVHNLAIDIADRVQPSGTGLFKVYLSQAVESPIGRSFRIGSRCDW